MLLNRQLNHSTKNRCVCTGRTVNHEHSLIHQRLTISQMHRPKHQWLQDWNTGSWKCHTILFTDIPSIPAGLYITLNLIGVGGVGGGAAAFCSASQYIFRDMKSSLENHNGMTASFIFGWGQHHSACRACHTLHLPLRAALKPWSVWLWLTECSSAFFVLVWLTECSSPFFVLVWFGRMFPPFLQGD